MSKTMEGHRARKRFGQNFLNDEQVIDNIVACIHPQEGEALVEIGPGLAALTLPVSQQVSKLHVVELDRDLADRLEQRAEFKERLIVHRFDALKFNFVALSESLDQPLRVFGNLPYNISTPLIFHLLASSAHIKDMHFMLQKEVVDRMAAGPGSKSFGRLSVMVQQRCKVEPVLHVPPSAFTPAPKVESAVVRLTPYQEPPYPVTDLTLLNHVCHTAFHQRRKTLRNNLKKLMSEEEIVALGLNPAARPETLNVSDFVNITNWLHTNKKHDE